MAIGRPGRLIQKYAANRLYGVHWLWMTKRAIFTPSVCPDLFQPEHVDCWKFDSRTKKMKPSHVHAFESRFDSLQRRIQWSQAVVESRILFQSKEELAKIIIQFVLSFCQ